MASPTIESMCCMDSNGDFKNEYLIDFKTFSYNVVSVFASILGMFGGIYQILPREAPVGSVSRGRFFKTRGRLIIKWLALADLMASLGIFIRAVSWMADKSLGTIDDDNLVGHIFCIVTSAWIHYFYTATYFWTFIYALDVKKVLQEKRLSPRLYHFICWVMPLILCLIGLLFLYLPDLNCHSRRNNPFARFLPNYLSTFVPILMVMISNPILYCLAFSKVEKLLASQRGRFTHSERKVVDGLRKKFLLINAVFYVCWTPNIINGIVLWTAWDNLPKNFIIAVWYFMAILNPLQAVFNCVVYRSWDTSGRIRLPVWFSSRISGRHHEEQVLSQTKAGPSGLEEEEDLSDDSYSSDSPGPRPWSQQLIFKPHERTPLMKPGYRIPDSSGSQDSLNVESRINSPKKT
ncbi:G-protein coupled receptor 143-like [Oratosquilla oratoria]|uniref:G-protein coupled receptor 143-like n=1 Tax=Oratosquilla oratoria TaxID=337810 RepID=UPI003F77292A